MSGKTGSRPYRSAVRADVAERTRQRIVAAAAERLRTEGAAGFSLEAVARLAGVTRLTVYNQFGSRRALLEAVFDDRAADGGLLQIPEAMADPDARRGLSRLIRIFCGFWSGAAAAVGAIHAAAGTDPEFRTALSERNERRRRALTVLVERILGRSDRVGDAVDLIFMLTSQAAFAQLVRDRGPDAVCALIEAAVEDVLRRAGP